MNWLDVVIKLLQSIEEIIATIDNITGDNDVRVSEKKKITPPEVGWLITELRVRLQRREV